MGLCSVFPSHFSSFVLVMATAPSDSALWKKENERQSLTLPSRWRTPRMLDSKGWWPPERQHQRWTPHRTEPLASHRPPPVCQSHLYTYNRTVWHLRVCTIHAFHKIMLYFHCNLCCDIASLSLPDQTQRVFSNVDQTPQGFHRLMGCRCHIGKLVK